MSHSRRYDAQTEESVGATLSSSAAQNGRDPTRNRGTVDCSTGTSTLADGSGSIPGYLNSCDATEIAGGSVGGGTPSGGGSVPAPGGLALLLVGLAGIGRKMRAKKA